MRLTGINIKGFKSFARNTQLNFNERVTGVIGPNGSGKSNIVDAIRWVLGEQKPTELRLDNMPDVIFNGTKKIKKGSMAQVTLNFDNTSNILPSEYSTVSVSRTLYSTGESIYRLNDVPCRLKDIRNLFIDTGIGPDSYAIIALNMVEDILADNNNSRRFMFEQAAGISKFKKRKQETIRQLSNTRSDLDRVEDLMFEIENNLKELEKQARKARQFINLKTRYKDEAIKLNLQKYDKLEDSYMEIVKNVSIAISRYRETDTYIISKEAILQDLKKNIVIKDKGLNDHQRKINFHIEKLRNAESEKQVLNQKLAFNKNKSEELHLENDQINEQLASNNQKYYRITARIEDELKKLDQLKDVLTLEEKKLADLKSRYDIEKSKIDDKNRLRREMEDHKFQLLKSNAVLASTIENLSKDIELKSQSQAKIELESTGHLKKLRSLREEAKILESRSKELKLQKESRMKTAEKINQEINNLNEEYDQLSRKLDARKNEFRLVKSMIDNLEGFPESIKYLNKNWSDKFPLVTDIISASDKYKPALESFLEPYLNYFVVENSRQALEAVNMLRKSQKGKANFFILDKIDNSATKKRIDSSFIYAPDIVQYDKKYAGLIMKLLGNVFISPLGLDEVNTFDDEVVIIDSTGSLLAGSYFISGGSAGLFEGKKIGRKQSLVELNSLISSYEKKLKELSGEIHKNKSLSIELDSQSHDMEYKLVTDELQSINNQISQVEIKSGFTENASAELLTEIDAANRKIEDCKVSISENEKNIRLAEASLPEISIPDQTGNTDIDSMVAELSDMSGRANSARIEMLKQQNLISVLEKDHDYLASDKRNHDKKLRDNSTLLKKMQEEIEMMTSNDSQIENDLVLMYKLKAEYESELDEIERSYFEERNTITELENEISDKKNQLGKSQYLINQLKEQQMDIEYRKNTISDRLKIEFGIDIKDYLAYDRSDEDEHSLGDKVERLRYKIENFGEVNTMAIEAHNEMSQRYQTIQQQKNDILEAERSLRKTISEIEKTATELFLSALEVIRVHFKKVFTTLFTEGDTCDLLLEDPDNPLESKILITAKPKGKRPKTISQLSGGEKALTAIALLFSLYLFKPAPFCIFDEVDAPLDDANIRKFNNIIREFSANSQFIVVTHNKTTMTAVDVLYGVFMQEPGVSEVAEVDLREFENTSLAEPSLN